MKLSPFSLEVISLVPFPFPNNNDTGFPSALISLLFYETSLKCHLKCILRFQKQIHNNQRNAVSNALWEGAIAKSEKVKVGERERNAVMGRQPFHFKLDNDPHNKS